MIKLTNKMVCIHEECNEDIFCLTHTNILIWKYVNKQII